MGFHDLLEKSGKGLNESRQIYTLFEVNLGGTVGTVYFADSNLNIDGTYYDGKIDRVSSVNRFLHPDKNSYEVSKLEVSLFNQDDKFSTGKWVKTNLIGQHAQMKLRVGTLNSTEYVGMIKDFGYDCDNDLFTISVEDFTRSLWEKKIPPKIINKDDIPGDYIEPGTPLPWVYGLFRPSQTGDVSPPFFRYAWGIPALQAGTYCGGTEIGGYHRYGTMEYLVAGHPMGTINEFYVDGTKFGTFDERSFETGGTTKWAWHLSGTYHSLLGGTGNVCWIESTYNPSGTSIFHVTGWGATHDNTLGGTFCRRFADVLVHAIKNIGNLSDSQLGTFERDSRDVHRYINEQISLKDFIDEACFASADRTFYFDKAGKANLAHEDWLGSLGTATFKEEDILRFRFSQDQENLYNRINYYTYWSEPTDVYTTYLQQDSNRSKRETSLTRELDVFDRWHYTTTVNFSQLKAAETSEEYLRQFQDAPYGVQIDVPMALAAKVDLRDHINITHSRAPFGGTGGWIERNLRVIGLEQDYTNKITTIDAWSQGHPFDVLGEAMDEYYSHWWRLGDGTAQLYDDVTCRENFKITTAGTNYAWGTASDGSNVLFDAGADDLGADFGYTYWGGNYQGIASRKSNYQLAAFTKPLDVSTKENIIYSDVDPGNLTDGGFEWGIGTAGQILFRIYLGGPGTKFWWMEKESQKDIVGTSAWQMIGVAFDRIDYWGGFFLDGSRIGTEFRAKAAYYDARGSYAYLCGSPEHTGSYYQGYLGDLALAGLASVTGDQWQGGTMVDYADEQQHRMWRFLKHRYGL